jgi:hypothetical protein
MAERKTFIMKYRQGSFGVQSAQITASNAENANRLGEWWCNQRVNCKFIRVEPAVVADESDMPSEVPEERRAMPSAAVTRNVNEDLEREEAAATAKHTQEAAVAGSRRK